MHVCGMCVWWSPLAGLLDDSSPLLSVSTYSALMYFLDDGAALAGIFLAGLACGTQEEVRK